ncbi:MAG: putative manganese transporter [Thermodesulfobacteriota bacterium]
MAEYLHVFINSLMITLFVFVMMMLVDYINVLTRGKITVVMHGGRFQQYILASFLGATPGCLGAFMNVSFYVRGLLSFGAITGGMIATAGDESYVILAMFPKTAMILHVLLFIFGIIFAWLIDKIVPLLKITPCKECELAPLHIDDKECRCFDASVWKIFPKILFLRTIIMVVSILFLLLIGFGIIGPKEWGWERTSLFILLWIALLISAIVPDHYLREHIIDHIIKKHIWRVFLWTFFALLIVHVGLEQWNLEGFVKENMAWILVISALLGIIPESGPHLIFVTMFAQGLIPFSVLLTSSFVQDGHGMLPLLSHSLRDSILIKLFNLAFGLGVGIIFYWIGL